MTDFNANENRYIAWEYEKDRDERTYTIKSRSICLLVTKVNMPIVAISSIPRLFEVEKITSLEQLA